MKTSNIEKQQAEILKRKRKEILKKSNLKSEHKSIQIFFDQYNIHPSERYSSQRYQPTNRKNQHTKQIQQMDYLLISGNANLKNRNQELIGSMHKQKLEQSSIRNLQQSHNMNNMVFSFKIDNGHLLKNSHNSNGLNSIDMKSHSHSQQYLKNKPPNNTHIFQNNGSNSCQTLHNNLLKIPEQPQKSFDKKWQDLQSAQQTQLQKQKQQIDTLNNKLANMIKQNQKLVKQCAMLKQKCTYQRVGHYGYHYSASMDKEKRKSREKQKHRYQQEKNRQIKAYQQLIEKQQKQLEVMLVKWQSEIEIKNKEIAQITGSYFEKKSKFNERINELQNKINQQYETIESLKGKNIDLQKQKQSLQLEINKIRNEINEKQLECKVFDHQLYQIKRSNELLLEQKNNLVQKLTTMETTLKNKQTNLKKDKEQIFSSLGSDRVLIVNGHKYRTENKIMFNTEF